MSEHDDRSDEQKEKLSARGRLTVLFDEGTFKELGRLVESSGRSPKRIPGDGVVTGYGYVSGRLVYAYAQDYTFMGGSLGEMQAMKICRVQDEALASGAPIVALLESGGARIQEGISALSGYGNIFYRNCMASGVIPQIAVVFDTCAGGAAYSPALMDFVFMIGGRSKMFITGPDVIKVVTGENVTGEELGGAATHTGVSGVAHFMCPSERSCLRQVRRLLSFFPDAMKFSDAAGTKSTLEKNFYVPPVKVGLDRIVPQNPKTGYDMRDIVSNVLENPLESQAAFAPNCITTFGRVGGIAVGLVANQPLAHAGCIDSDASMKMARFIRFCSNIRLPLITLVDTPGYLPGVHQEKNGLIRHGAKLLYAYSQSKSRKVTVIIRKAYGGAYIAMGSKSLGVDRVFAWPDTEIAVMGAEAAVNIICKRELFGADDPQMLLEQKTSEYKAHVMTPLTAASRGYIDDIIDPVTTQAVIYDCLKSFAAGKTDQGKEKDGNIPL